MLNSAQLHLLTVTNPGPGGGTSSNVGPWMATGAMITPRANHTQTLLQGAKVLIAGGGYASGLLNVITANAELYDPASRSFSATGSLAAPRAYHAATLLGNGKVLVTGGYYTQVLASAELFDPSTGSFTAAGSMTDSRVYQTATLLQNGKVLITGGFDASGKILSSAELYDPSSGSFTQTGSMSLARFGQSATLLPNGQVLIAGGETISGNVSSDAASAELFNPATGQFSLTGGMSVGREFASSALLNNGSVLIAGGSQVLTGTLREAEIYDLSTGVFSSTGAMGTPRFLLSSVTLSDGTVLVIGGDDGSSDLASVEIFNPTTGQFSPTWLMPSPHDYAAATLLPDGSVLVSGGMNQGQLSGAAATYPPPSLTAGSASSIFTVDNPVPIIAGLSTNTSPAGQQVIVNGTNFVSGSDVLVNGIAVASFGTPSAPNQVWYYPDVAGIYSVSVNNPTPGGGISNSVALQVNVSVQITPARALWAPGSTNQLSASVSGTTNTGVTWSLQEGGLAGTIDSTGLYTAGQTAGTYHIVATSVAEPSQSAVAPVIIGPDAGEMSAAPQLITPRSEEAEILMANGEVLVAGGNNSSGDSAAAEIYDPSTNSFSATGSMSVPRSDPAIALLSKGSVMVAGGGRGVLGDFITGAEIYNPATGLFSTTSSMVDPTLSAQTLTTLQNGKVLVIGSTASAELYDPSTGAFSLTGNLTTDRRNGFTATLLNNGKVLVAGGSPGSSAELYDPATGTFSPTGSMAVSRYYAVAIPLKNGTVFMVGGNWTYSPVPAEIYNPSTGTFTPISTYPVYNLYGFLDGVQLKNGLVFIGGGLLTDGTVSPPEAHQTQFFDPGSGTFYAGPLLSQTLFFNWTAMTVLPNGNVLITGDLTDAASSIYTPASTDPLPAATRESRNIAATQVVATPFKQSLR